MNLKQLNPELMKAVCSDQVLDVWKHLTKIQKSGCDVTDVGSEINTIWLHVCAEGAMKCVQALLTDQYARKYLDLNCCDEDEDTALLLALKRYHLKVAEILLDEDGLDLTARNKALQSALDLVCKQRILQLLPQLSDLDRIKFSSEENRSAYEYYAILTCIECGTDQILQYLLDQGFKVHHNIDDEIGTPLHYASEVGSLQSVERILQRGADIEALTKTIVQTPLMKAAQSGHLDIVTKLVEAGAEIDRQTEECSTALTLACHFGREEVAFCLMDRGADCSISNPWGFTALYMATDSPNILRRMLLQGKADVKQRCGERLEAPLHLAAVIGSSESFELLLSAGADVDTLTLYTETPLWLALWKSHNNILHYCLAYNCQIHTMSNGCQVFAWKYTPLELALGVGNLEAAHFLYLAGAVFINEDYFAEGSSSNSDLYPHWVRLRPELLEYVFNNESVCKWFTYVTQNPRTLGNCCVIKLRQILGPKEFVARVAQLPLPWRLREMVYVTSIGKSVPGV